MSIRRNALWNLLGAGAPLALGAVSIPYLIRTVGIEIVGLLTLIWALIGYFSLFDLGLSRALTQQLAATRSAGQLESLPTLMKTGMFLTGITGTVGGAILVILAFPLSYKWLGVSGILQPDTASALLIAAVGIPLATLTNGLRGALEAYGQFKTVNLQRLALGMSNFALPALSAYFYGASLSMMVLGLIIGRLIILGTHIYYTVRLLPFNWIKVPIKISTGKRLYSFGLWMTISNIVSPLIVYVDRFFIAALISANAIAYYAIPHEFIVRILIIPGALTAALFPQLASLFVESEKVAMGLYYKCLKVVGLIMLPLIVVMIAGSGWGLTLWLGSEFSKNSSTVFIILAAGLFFNAVAQVPFAALQASGHAKITAAIHLVELLIYIPALYFALSSFGLIGAAFVCAARYALDAVILIGSLEIIVGTRKTGQMISSASSNG